MTRQNASRFLPIVQAYVDGKTIQCNDGTVEHPEWRDLNWFNCTEEPSHYRVKPELREWQIHQCNADCDMFIISSEELAKHRCGGETVKVREVLP